MGLKTLLSFCLIIGSLGNRFELYNNCRFSIWPVIKGYPGHPNLENGGFELRAYQARVINTPGNWAGRFWAKTDCDDSGKCATGDCNGRIQCNGTDGIAPVSVVEVKLKNAGGLDFYRISLVDGYNLPIKIAPIGGFNRSSLYDCTAAACYANLNAQCPKELAIKQYGLKIACKSPCSHFNTDEYCCRGAYSSYDACKYQLWPVNYRAIFESACPDAHSFAYDISNSTFTCRGTPNTNYDIIFCP